MSNGRKSPQTPCRRRNPTRSLAPESPRTWNPAPPPVGGPCHDNDTSGPPVPALTYDTAGAGEMYSPTAAGAAYTAGADEMYSSTGAGAAITGAGAACTAGAGEKYSTTAITGAGAA